MQFETVGLRTRQVSGQKKQSWSCRSGVVKHGLVTLVVIMILKDTATFQVLFIVSLFLAWNITTAEINSGIYVLNPLMHNFNFEDKTWLVLLLRTSSD